MERKASGGQKLLLETDASSSKDRKTVAPPPARLPKSCQVSKGRIYDRIDRRKSACERGLKRANLCFEASRLLRWEERFLPPGLLDRPVALLPPPAPCFLYPKEEKGPEEKQPQYLPSDTPLKMGGRSLLALVVSCVLLLPSQVSIRGARPY